MKKILLVLIVISLIAGITVAGGFGLTSVTANTDPEDPIPVAWYTFDNPENLGEDTSGNGNDLLAKGKPASRAEGKFGGCLYLDGKSALVAKTDDKGADFIDTSALTTGNLTITYWFKVTKADIAAFNPEADWRRIVSHGFCWGEPMGGFTSINNPGNDAGPTNKGPLYLYSNTMVDHENQAGRADIPNINGYPNAFDEQWTFIAFTMDAAASKGQYYINGVKVSEVETASLGKFKMDSPLAFALGAHWYEANGTDNFVQSYTGSLDNMGVFDTVLTEKEIDFVMKNRQKEENTAPKGSSSMEGDAIVLRFNSVRNVCNYVKKTDFAAIALLDESMKIKFWGANPTIEIQQEEDLRIDLDEYKYMKIKYCARTKNPNTIIQFSTSLQADVFSNDALTFERKNNGVWDVPVFDMSKRSGWSGGLKSLNILLTTVSDQDTDAIFIEYIAFFKDKTEADSFGAITEEQRKKLDPVSLYFSKGYRHPLAEVSGNDWLRTVILCIVSGLVGAAAAAGASIFIFRKRAKKQV